MSSTNISKSVQLTSMSKQSAHMKESGKVSSYDDRKELKTLYYAHSFQKNKYWSLIIKIIISLQCI